MIEIVEKKRQEENNPIDKWADAYETTILGY